MSNDCNGPVNSDGCAEKSLVVSRGTIPKYLYSVRNSSPRRIRRFDSLNRGANSGNPSNNQAPIKNENPGKKQHAYSIDLHIIVLQIIENQVTIDESILPTRYTLRFE